MTPLKIGTIVQVVRLSVLAGAIGEVVALDVWGAGRCLCGCGRFGCGRGYGVNLARPVDGTTRYCIGREFLIPLTPPDDQVDEHASEGMGVGAAIV